VVGADAHGDVGHQVPPGQHAATGACRAELLQYRGGALQYRRDVHRLGQSQDLRLRQECAHLGWAQHGAGLLPRRPPGWSSDARSELRQQLASTFGRFTVDHLGAGPIIPRPMARRRQRPFLIQGSERASGVQANQPPAGGVRGRARMEVAPQAESPLGLPS
jgi:hypothetical protein